MSKPINFYVVSCSNMNALNGAAKFVKSFYENKELFAKENINVNIISNSDYFTNPIEYEKTQKHAFRKRLNSLASKSRFGSALRFIYGLWIQGGKSVNEFKKINNDNNSIVLLNELPSAYAFYSKYGNKYKTIFMLHNSGDLLSMFEENLPQNIIFKKFLYSIRDKIYNSATKLVCVSSSAENLFRELNPDLKEKTVHISIGQDCVAKCSFVTDILKIVCVGTICERKNQIALIKSLELIPDKSIQLILIGDGPMKCECQKYVKEHNMENQVCFAGAQNNVMEFLSNANLFALVSFDEGLPIAAQEAMNIGLPILITNVGGCSELIDGNGMLIDPDLQEITDAVLWFNNNKSLLQDMGLRSKTLFEKKYTKKVMFDNYIDLIKNF